LENGRYPATSEPIELGMQNSMFRDGESVFWEQERTNLLRQFSERVKPILQKSKPHLSVFAIAPQPLLAYLGHLLSDFPDVDLFQRQRNPDGWIWYPDSDTGLESGEVVQGKRSNNVGLAISLSATITPDRISCSIGTDAPIWAIQAKSPSVSYLRSRCQLDEFCHVYRETLDQIKTKYGHDARIHVFPAVPHSIAVELGRCRNPKADLPLVLYDQNNTNGGFVRALKIP
jgi:hypothetical protein